jgi:folate-binding protein YgfZ
VSLQLLLSALQAGDIDQLPAGDAVAQTAAAEQAVGVGWLTGESTVRIAGDDRAAFLHRLLTADLSTLSPDQGRRSLLLDTRGKIVADVDLWGGAKAWRAVVDRRVRGAFVDQLKRYVLRADVALEPTDEVLLVILGAGASSLLERVGAAPPTVKYGAASARIGGVSVWLQRSDRIPWGVRVVVPERAAEVVEVLAAADPGLEVLGPAALESLRVRAGVPGVDRELTGNEFPQEVGLEGAVSFDKGCYLGQETVARIHYRGHVNRRMCGLSFSAPVGVPAGLRSDSASAGEITSLTDSGGALAGLGFVRREHSEMGNELRVEGTEGTIATVRELPLG